MTCCGYGDAIFASKRAHGGFLADDLIELLRTQLHERGIGKRAAFEHTELFELLLRRRRLGSEIIFERFELEFAQIIVVTRRHLRADLAIEIVFDRALRDELG